jgi:hypothetical protein
MKAILLALATAATLIGGGAVAMQVAGDAPSDDQNVLHPQRLIIGLDLSQSNPLIDDPAFAARVAARIADAVRNMGFASEVHVRTFGSYDPNSNNFAYDTVLSVRSRPEAVAADIRKLIAGTPRLVASGKWRSQRNTNILAFLDNVTRAFGCRGMPTTIVLATDGIEDSVYARLDRGDHLPSPDNPQFRGCSQLLIYGLGQGGGNPRLTSRLRGEWANWARAAGFANFQGLNDW